MGKAMSLFENKRILFIGPHVDDIEFGCGGTISKINNKSEIFYLSFSFAEKSLLSGYVKKDIEAEVRAACKVLNVENVISKNYETREFPKSRQEILEDLIEIKKQIKPDIVFIPSSFDTHQDHATVHNEGFRAFKDITIFGYEASLNNRVFSPQLYCKLSKNDMDAKISALSCYRSQIEKKPVLIGLTRSLSVVRGAQVGCAYAEAFEVIRLVV
jgi:LmbE family N-acetylglucosaminyl deacetylase